MRQQPANPQRQGQAAIAHPSPPYTANLKDISAAPDDPTPSTTATTPFTHHNSSKLSTAISGLLPKLVQDANCCFPSKTCFSKVCLQELLSGLGPRATVEYNILADRLYRSPARSTKEVAGRILLLSGSQPFICNVCQLSPLPRIDLTRLLTNNSLICGSAYCTPSVAIRCGPRHSARCVLVLFRPQTNISEVCRKVPLSGLSQCQIGVQALSLSGAVNKLVQDAYCCLLRP